ncbi:Gfo/Idh/MocA family protein [Cohnella fermenti]|uniref:Gfo/Idh/MocA family oxidoreductase n=1 Tax=Cohnella fermenti TaxID=2565925 RepID=A0A4S4C7L5_9BACL|nr:Gfo/Idh/MocA family oxidoreductase [Cohnella fermenti]THF83284.1 Gfo/Idh/MocA family oxidoreductase [Cohnella fermenti]
MLRVGLIGFGFMGRMHFDNYERLMAEGQPVQLKAVCDIAIEQLKNGAANGNMATSKDVYDLSAYALYESVEDMLANEELDMIDITLPTYLHADLTCSLLAKGYHVLCEKPMARTEADARRMAEAAARSGRRLLIGQCLRFWPAYEYLKECVADKRYGETTAGYFYRGSEPPKGWFLNGELSGGCMLDMHIHDTDMINWLFGKPERVSSLGRKVLPGSGYDAVSTNYRYPDGKVINAQADWTYSGDHGFEMGFRVNFDNATVVLGPKGFRVHPADAPSFSPELSEDTGYYRQLRSFMEAVLEDKAIDACLPESTADSLAIVEAEIRSADSGGEWIELP